MKIKKETLNHIDIEKTFDIELANGTIISIRKWVQDSNDDSGYHTPESDWEYATKKDKELTGRLSETKQDKLWDFINELSLIK